MIHSDQKLTTILERIRQIEEQLTFLQRVELNPTNYRLSASGFIAEIDRMQTEVREYVIKMTKAPNAC